MDEKLIEVRNLKKYFNVGSGRILKAVDDVSFVINKGETLGLVGESGCGKTTCGRTVLGMYDATEGEVLYNNQNIFEMHKNDKNQFKKMHKLFFRIPMHH